MKKSALALLPILVTLSSTNAYTAQWVENITVGNWRGTITLDDWGFVGPDGRLANEFAPRNGFGNGTYDTMGAAYCLANPAACGIGQMQHVITSGPDGLTPDAPANIVGDFGSPYGPFPQANVDSLTSFYHWGYTTIAGSTFDNMLIDLDGDYKIAKDDMSFQFYSAIDYIQVVPAGGTRIGTVADGAYPTGLQFQPYALSDAQGWCGSIMASHPNAHEAMAGQIMFDVAFDVYSNFGGNLTYWSSEIIPMMEMRSFGDLSINLTAGGNTQAMNARAVVNNTDPTVLNQSVGPNTPVGDLYWHNRVSFMGGSVIPSQQFCGIESAAWKSGARGPGVKRYSSLLLSIGNSTDCVAAGGVWNNNAFSGMAFILRADGQRFVDYFDESVYGPDPMSQDTDGDTVPDFMDNCIEVANTSQQDSDGDGFGNACDADFNNDNQVNSLDIGLFKSMFFTSGDSVADLNSDGIVNSLDLGLFKSMFFQPPGPSGTAQ